MNEDILTPNEENEENVSESTDEEKGSNSTNESILNSIKKMLGYDSEDDTFNTDIMIHINTVFGILNQLGVGPEKAFSISDATSTWSDFFGKDTNFEMVKSYMYLKVRLVFDPPSTASLMDAIKESIKELQWRITTAAELKSRNVEEGERRNC